jgi:hypothetical protein
MKKGPGHMASALPLEMECKQCHKTMVMPYHWKELNQSQRHSPREVGITPEGSSALNAVKRHAIGVTPGMPGTE